MEGYRIAIIIPAYNEECTISNVVKSVKKYGKVIVVNDASTDMTEKLSKDAGAIIVSHKINKGYNETLNSGFKKAIELNYDAVITFDADGQHDPDVIPVFISNLNEGIDLVLGIRPKVQRLAEFIFKFYTKNRFSWEDPLCGMKGYNLSFRSIDNMCTYNSIGTEIALNFVKLGCSTIQIPIKVSKRKGKPKFGNILTSNILIMKALLIGVIRLNK